MEKFKVGDVIIVKDNKMSGCVKDTPLEIIGKSGPTLNCVTLDTNVTWNAYANGDTIEILDRKAIAKLKHKGIAVLEERLKVAKEELYILENFESDEEYAAYKLTEIIKTGGDVGAIARILKELKASNYL